MKSKGYTLEEIKRKSLHKRDPWLIVSVYDPVSIRLIYLFQNWHFITPNRLTLLSLLVGIPGVIFFALAAKGYYFLVLGVISFWLFVLLDCLDGRLARLRGCPTKLGALLEYLVGGLITVSYMAALTIGGYSISGSSVCLFAGLLWFAPFALLYFMRYNAQTMGQGIRGKLVAASKTIKSSLIINFDSFMSRKRLLPFPTDIEIYLIVFGIAPLTGHIVIGIYIASAYFWAMYIVDVVLLFRPSPKEVEDED